VATRDKKVLRCTPNFLASADTFSNPASSRVLTLTDSRGAFPTPNKFILMLPLQMTGSGNRRS
ncbi:hypothetical protein, partial [Klebsiella variicola]